MKILYQDYFEQALHKSRFTNPEKFVSHAGSGHRRSAFQISFSFVSSEQVQSSSIRLVIN